MFDLLDRLLDVVVRVDGDWRVSWANKQSTSLLGDMVGKDFWTMFPANGDERRALGQKAMDDRVPTLIDARIESLDRWFEFRFEPVDHKHELWIVGRDITDRRNVDVRLREEIRRLVVQLDTAERRERQRIAQILHGDLQQVIVAAQLTVSGLRKAAGDAAQTIEYSEKALALLSDAQETTRLLSTELHPVMLQSEGLIAAMRWLARSFHEKHGLVVGIQSSEYTEEVASDLQHLLFDTARECLLNVVKHAQIDHASLEVIKTQEAVELRVTDQGAGFDPSVRRGEDGGFGLQAITLRVNALGGSVDIQSAPGEGTTVRITVPSPTASPSK